MSSKQQPLIWKDFDQGIADSPYKGHALLRAADIDSFPGAVKSTKKPGPVFHSIRTQTFTADAASDVCTTAQTVETNGQTSYGAAVYFTTTGTLPAGLSTGTVYYLYYISSTEFKVCTSYKNSAGSAAGTVINITDAGTGTHTINQLPIGTINWILEDPRTNYIWMLGSNGRVWFIPSGSIAYLLHNSALENVSSGITNAAGNGLALNNFSSTSSTWLFVYRNAKVDVIDIFGNTTIEALGWSNNWQSLNSGAGSGNTHEALKAQDNIIYACDDRYVASIAEVAGSTFDPANGATYTFNNQALDLPSLEIATCLEELGVNLLVGGSRFNYIYPWDRTSDSYNLPIAVPEFSVYKMKNVGGTVKILAGLWGNIYETQGSYVKFVRRVPIYTTNNANGIYSNMISWGGIAALNGTLLFGVGVTSGATNSGVWRLFPDGRLVMDNYPSTGMAKVVGLWAKSEFYMMGYSGGADSFNSNLYGTVLYDNYQTVLQSALFTVGNKIKKATYSRMEVQIAKPAAAASAIRVSYRTDTSGSFTTLDTYSGDSATTLFTTENLGLTDIETIQLQVEMHDGNNSVVAELLEVRLYP